MHSHPIREWILFSLVWLALAIPVRVLTRPSGESIVSPPAPADEHAVSALAVLRYTAAPAHLRISQRETVLWDDDALPAEEAENIIELLLDEGHAELTVEARWSEAGRHVLELELFPDEMNSRTAHAWAEESLDEVFLFHWHAGDDY